MVSSENSIGTALKENHQKKQEEFGSYMVEIRTYNDFQMLENIPSTHTEDYDILLDIQQP